MSILDKLFRRKEQTATTEASSPQEESSPLLKRTLDAVQQGQSALPAFLRYPCDPISKQMFEPHMRDIYNSKCNYQFRLYTGIANVSPEIRQISPTEEIHIYWKDKKSAWCSVSALKSPSVKTSPLKNWIQADDLFEMLRQNEMLLRYPAAWGMLDYQSIEKRYLIQSDIYSKLHQFAESHVFCHIFSLDHHYYKKFILLARQEMIAWRVECTIPSDSSEVAPPDFLPPALVFGSFFPLLLTTESISK